MCVCVVVLRLVIVGFAMMVIWLVHTFLSILMYPVDADANQPRLQQIPILKFMTALVSILCFIDRAVNALRLYPLFSLSARLHSIPIILALQYFEMHQK